MRQAGFELSAEGERELLERYAPVLRFSEKERFFPTRVDDYVESCDALYDGRQGKWIRGPLAVERLVAHNDANSYLRFVARDGGQGSKEAPSLRGSLIKWVALALYLFLGCAALWWLYDISGTVGRLISGGLIFAVSFSLSKNERAQTPVKMALSLPRTIVRLLEIVLQDPKSLAIAGGVHLIFTFSNFFLLWLLTDVRSPLLAFIAASPLGLFYYALITDSAGAVVQLKSGRSVKWADEAHLKYREQIVGDGSGGRPERGGFRGFFAAIRRVFSREISQAPVSEHVCTYYGRVARVGKDWTVLQYFYFYAFNDWRSYGGMNLHEGDWESVTVYVPGYPPKDGTEPFGVAYSQHHGKEFLLWKHTQHLAEQAGNHEFHAVVYVALGSHANYPFADSRIDPSEMERFGLLQNTVSRIELGARRIGLFGGRLPADTADGLGPHLVPIGESRSQALERYLAELDRPDERASGTERARCLRGRLEPITDGDPAWVEYQGLWGDRTDVPDESGPSGPRWRKLAHGRLEERTAWKDPVGWLEERKADAFGSKASEDLRDIVAHMWALDGSPPFEPLEECARWDGGPGQTHNPLEDFDGFLDHCDESVLILGASKDLNRMILHRLAQLQMRRVRDGKSRRVPAILPLSPRALSGTGTADADIPAGAEEQKKATDRRVVALRKRIAAELSALYGLPAAVFEEWINKKEFGETEGDETGVMLFIELEAQGPSEGWMEAFRSFVADSQVIVALGCKEDVDLGLSCSENGTQITQTNADERSPFLCLMVPPRGHVDCLVKAQAPKKERVAAALGIDSDSEWAELDHLTTANLKLLLQSTAQSQDFPDQYVTHKLGQIGEKQGERLCHWLSWLAKRMQEEGQRLYQVDRMQPKWLAWPFPRLIYYVVEGLIPFLLVGWITWHVMGAYPFFTSADIATSQTFRFLFGGATAAAFWLVAHRRFGMRWAAIAGIAFSLAVVIGGYRFIKDLFEVSKVGVPLGLAVVGLYWTYGRVYGSGRNRYGARAAWDTIDIFETRHFSGRRALLGAATGVLFGFVLWVLVGGYAILPDMFERSRAEILRATRFPHAVAFAIGTVLGMGFFFLWGFGKAHREPNRDRQIAPYQRITGARNNAIITGLLGALFMGTPYVVGGAMLLRDVRPLPHFADFKAFAAWLGLWAGVFIGLVCGGLTVLQHYVLRFVLPIGRRDLYELLERAEACDLLVRRVRAEEDEAGKPIKGGDAYEFITCSVMDHFAGWSK